MQFIRSLVFSVIMIIATIIHATVSLPLFLAPWSVRYRFMTIYSRYMTWFAKVICGIKYEVIGLENLPKENCIILSNHQSTWETLAFQAIFPPQSWVVKKQLLKIPFFGWAFALLEPIAIDRNLPGSALDQILEQGKDRLKQGRWVVIFPEGTRVDLNKTIKYARGGAVLAEATKKPVVPVAHNAGKFWARKAFIKKPGVIKVNIGPVIDTKDKDSYAINEIAKTWIESEKRKMYAEN